jgi:quercetin dioxygenase-like cupin family protein
LKTPIEDFLININVEADLDEEHATAVVRAGHHRRIDPAMHTGIHKEVLTPPLMADGNLQLYKALIEPGGSTGETFFTTFTGYQIGYVIEGMLELHVGKKLLRLQAGDSFCYENQMPRRWCNPGTTNTIVLWAVTLPASETQKRKSKSKSVKR